MNGKKKTPKVPGFMRAVLAENVRALMDAHYRESSNKPKALSKDAGVSLSTVQRILSKEVGATIDNIEAISQVFDMSVYQLLLPHLSVTNPQVVTGALKNEELMYRRWRQERAIAKNPQHEDKQQEAPVDDK
jgi:transcriptional regulator with XRE-family HTH domain